MRTLSVLVLALVLAPPAAPLGPPAPCPVPDFIGGTLLVAGGPNEWVRARFTVTSTMTGTFWAEVPFAAVAHEDAFGFAAERASVALFVEDAAGNVLARPGLAMYPYGAQADLPGGTVRLSALDGACRAAAGGNQLTLPPGSYTAVALGATERGEGVGMALPQGVVITSVERGPSARLSEQDYSCVAKARVAAEGFATEALALCDTAYAAAGKAYRVLFLGHPADIAHEVYWVSPEGERLDVEFYDIGTGAPGTWRLAIPRYGTALGQPVFLPFPAGLVARDEGGVFGAFAGVP